MKIMVFGANGMQGRYLIKYFESKYTVIPVTRNQLDLATATARQVSALILAHRPNLIVNAAGVIKHRSYNILDMIAVNTAFPHVAARAAQEIGCKFIHMTTDCVFSGRKGDYDEEDAHDCLDDYGKSKSLGEPTLATVIRTSIIGEELDNKLSLIEWAKSQRGKRVRGFTDHRWNGVTCLEFAKLVDRMIEQDNFWQGVRHVHSPNAVNKFELLTMINAAFDLELDIVPYQSSVCWRDLASIYSNPVQLSLEQQLAELREFKLE